MYEKICSWENLLIAHRKASSGKRGKSAAAVFEYKLADNLLALQHELESRTYLPGAYNSFIIHDPKRRLISAAPFRDRVVHHALCNVIEPVFEASFSSASYANRVGQGTHRALARAQALARRFAYVLEFDVEQFFPAVDHLILRGILARKIDDPSVMWLIDRILDSGIGILGSEYNMRCFPGDTEDDELRPRGLPIGNLTSQFWANCYLNHFDHFVQRELRCRGYVRYVDDALAFAEDKRTLLTWRDVILKRLASLRLTIHPGAHPRPTSEGFPFLGFVVYPDHKRLKRRNALVYRRRLKELVAGWVAGQISKECVVASLRGWINHARYGDTWGLRKSILSHLPKISGGKPCKPNRWSSSPAPMTSSPG
jgi:retron-type reverse transcriptase